MKVLVPLAGVDERFEKFFGTIKPLVSIRETTVIELCMSLVLPLASNFRFICLKEHDKKYQIRDFLINHFPMSSVAILDAPTEGAMSSVLTQKDWLLESNEELLIFLADIYFKGELPSLKSLGKNIKGIIPYFTSRHPKYSYLEMDKDHRVTRVAEKEVISDCASAGWYFFSNTSDVVWAGEKMINGNLRVRNAFYVCPVYNELIKRGDVIYGYPGDCIADLGSPEGIALYRDQLCL